MRDYAALIVRPSSPHGPGSEFVELLAAVLDDFGLTAIEEVDGGIGDEIDAGAVRAFFAAAESRDAAAAEVARRFPDVDVVRAEISDEDWAARSQAALNAIRVGDMVVAPPWDIPEGDARSTIIILPSTGFGTGHHATTRLCLAALQRAAPAGKAVIDVGTGSGVLALAAAKLGASRAVGIDNDQDAIDNALENRDLNAASEVEFRCSGLEASATEGPFDIVLANLTGAVLIRLSRELTAIAAADGRLILSGLREEEEADVVSAFGRPLIARDAEDGWVCLVLEITRSRNHPNRSLTFSNTDLPSSSVSVGAGVPIGIVSASVSSAARWSFVTFFGTSTLTCT